MRRAPTLIATFAAILSMATPAQAKGERVAWGLSGGGLEREVHVPTTSISMSPRAVPPAPAPVHRYRLVEYFSVGPRTYPGMTGWYYPPAPGRSARVHFPDVELPDYRWWSLGPAFERQVQAALTGAGSSRNPLPAVLAIACLLAGVASVIRSGRWLARVERA